MANPYTNNPKPITTPKTNGESHPSSAVNQSVRELRQAFQGVSRYIRNHDLPTMRNDLEDRVREHPLATVLIGFGIGYLLGKILK